MKILIDICFDMTQVMKKKVLLKLSGEALSNGGAEVYDYAKLDDLLDKISDLSHRVELGIVVWGGNIWRYKDNVGTGIERVTSDYIGMTATIINAIVLSEKLAQRGCSVSVYSPGNMQIPNCTRVYDVHKVRSDLAAGNIVFCAGGTWNPYATTDSAAIFRALELNCDVMIKATKVDGIYTDDPARVPDAQKYDVLHLDEAFELQVNIMDHPALALAADEQLPIWVCRLHDIDKYGDEHIWTWVLPVGKTKEDFSLS